MMLLGQAWCRCARMLSSLDLFPFPLLFSFMAASALSGLLSVLGITVPTLVRPSERSCIRGARRAFESAPLLHIFPHSIVVTHTAGYYSCYFQPSAPARRPRYQDSPLAAPGLARAFSVPGLFLVPSADEARSNGITEGREGPPA